LIRHFNPAKPTWEIIHLRAGVAAASADIARVLFYIFVVIFLVLLVLGLLAEFESAASLHGRSPNRVQFPGKPHSMRLLYFVGPSLLERNTS
jgi:hypothetical protein